MPNFDWVKARSACSLGAVFHLLREVVDSDVRSANELKRDGVEFEINWEASQKIIVVRTRDKGGMPESQSIVFELLADEIAVYLSASQTDKRLLSAKPELSVDGECFLRVEGENEPQKPWQFSRKALEDLFFGF